MIKYTGSKLKLLPYILKIIKKVNPNSVLDAFSGSTRISQELAKLNYIVYSNDIAFYSYILNQCFLLNKKEKSYYQNLIDHLNNVNPSYGWYSENYGGCQDNEFSIGNDGLKKPFQLKNTMKLDGIRNEIDSLKLDDIDKQVQLTSLMLGLDKVDNTIGHYVSYLNKWSTRSYKDLFLEIPNVWINEKDHFIFNDDIFNIIDKIPKIDLVYLDPPYGSNNEKMPSSRVRYLSYYHIWTTICLNDKPELFGKQKRRVDSSDLISQSKFEDFRKNDKGNYVVIDHINQLIKLLNCNYILLSYNSGGRATQENLNKILNENGKIIDFFEIDYKKNVMQSMKWTNQWVNQINIKNKEFLFLLQKN